MAPQSFTTGTTGAGAGAGVGAGATGVFTATGFSGTTDTGVGGGVLKDLNKFRIDER